MYWRRHYGRLGHVLDGYLSNYKQRHMKTSLAGVTVSPVNMEDRKNLGIKAGDTVKVHQKIQDKGKTRIQIFEGLVLARKHGSEPGATFTVRKVASGVGVEKIYPLYSPSIDKIEIVKRAKVRRSKLYYIREKVNREIKRQMRRMSLVSISSESEAEMAIKQAEVEAKAAADAEALAVEAQKDAAAKAELEATQAAAAEAEPTEVADETAVEETPAETTKVAEEVPAEVASEEKAEDTETEKKD